jgi:hypothetical protein
VEASACAPSQEVQAGAQLAQVVRLHVQTAQQRHGGSERSEFTGEARRQQGEGSKKWLLLFYLVCIIGLRAPLSLLRLLDDAP